MGEIIHLSCNKCNLKKQFNLGAGKLSIRASVIEDTLTGEDLAQWHKLQEEDKIGFFFWQYDLAYCDSCHELKSVFHVNIKDKDEQVLHLGCRCDTCNKQLQPMANNQQVLCPVCKTESLQRMRAGMWS